MMKILLITDQYIDIRKDECFCNFALLGTLKNMAVLGDLHIAANELNPRKPASQPINQKIDFISCNHVVFLRETTSSVKSYIQNLTYNYNVLENLIPNMDLIILYIPSGNSGIAFKIAKKNKKKILSFLVACPWDALHNHHRLFARIMAPFRFLSTRRIIKNSDYVHYVTKKFLQHRYPTKGLSLGCSDVNIEAQSISVLNNRLNKFVDRNKSDVINLLTIANIDVRYKGHEYVMHSISKLNKIGNRRYIYHLVGNGKGLYLQQLCKSLNIEDQVIFHGRKTINEIMYILRECDIYLQPSLQEGLPRSLVEAMSFALPCIGFNTGGIPELLESEFVVPKKNVEGLIASLIRLEDEQVYIQTAKRNFEEALKYEHTNLRNRIQNFYKEIGGLL